MPWILLGLGVPLCPGSSSGMGVLLCPGSSSGWGSSCALGPPWAWGSSSARGLPRQGPGPPLPGLCHSPALGPLDTAPAEPAPQDGGTPVPRCGLLGALAQALPAVAVLLARSQGSCQGEDGILPPSDKEAGVRHAWGPGAPPGRGKAAQASSCRLVSEGPSRAGGRPRVHRGPQGACSSRGAHSHWQDRGTRASPLPSRRAAWPTDYIVSRPCVCVMRTTDTEKH